MKKIICTVITILLTGSLLAGCTSYFSRDSFSGFSGSQYGKTMKAHFSSFNGNKGAYISLKEGDKISIDYALTCGEGPLTLTFEYKNKNVIFTNSETSGTEEITVDSSQKYILRLAGEKAKGSYDISWSINP